MSRGHRPELFLVPERLNETFAGPTVEAQAKPGDWGAQVVGDGRQRLRPFRHQPMDARLHRVERPRDLAGLVGAGLPDRDDGTVSDLSCGAGEIAERTRDSPLFETRLGLGPDVSPCAAITDQGYDSKRNQAARTRGIAPIIPHKAHAKKRPAFFPKPSIEQEPGSSGPSESSSASSASPAAAGKPRPASQPASPSLSDSSSSNPSTPPRTMRAVAASEAPLPPLRSDPRGSCATVSEERDQRWRR